MLADAVGEVVEVEERVEGEGPLALFRPQVIVDGEVEFVRDGVLETLEQAMGVETEDQRRLLYTKLSEIIQNRERLQGKDLNGGPFTLTFGDVETSTTDFEKEAYSTLFGNHKKDHQFFINIRGFLNIEGYDNRQALFLTGISHEMVHEILPEEEQTPELLPQLEEELASEDASSLLDSREDRAFAKLALSFGGTSKPSILFLRTP